MNEAREFVYTVRCHDLLSIDKKRWDSIQFGVARTSNVRENALLRIRSPHGLHELVDVQSEPSGVSHKLGFGVLVLPIYWLAVMVHVYAVQDRVGPNTGDEGEEY